MQTHIQLRHQNELQRQFGGGARGGGGGGGNSNGSSLATCEICGKSWAKLSDVLIHKQKRAHWTAAEKAALNLSEAAGVYSAAPRVEASYSPATAQGGAGNMYTPASATSGAGSAAASGGDNLYGALSVSPSAASTQYAEAATKLSMASSATYQGSSVGSSTHYSNSAAASVAAPPGLYNPLPSEAYDALKS